MINQTQIVTTLGPILGLIAGYFAAWWGVDQATALGVLTALIGLVAAAYNAVITRKSAQITSVANMPEVNKIELSKTPNTAAINNATPDNVVVKQ